MHTISPTKFSANEISALVKLTIPLILSGLVQASVGFFSTVFLAHLGTEDLAAGSIGIWIFSTLMVILWGTLTSVSVLIAQKYGAKDDKAISHVLRDGLLLALIFVIPSTLLLLNISPLLLLLGQPAATVKLIHSYMYGLAWGLLPDLIGLVLMQFLIGLGHTRTEMVFSFVWVPINIFCNYALVFGKFGFPTLGIAGIGWGATLAYWISTLGLIIYLVLNRGYRHYFQYMWHLNHPNFLKELFQIGLPMGTMYSIEIGFFLVLTLLMGYFGYQAMAANQIALQYLGQLSVVTFSIAQAVTVRMGHTLGAQEPWLANRAAYLGILIAIIFMGFVALFYWFYPEVLIALDFNVTQKGNAEIVSFAIQFLALSALFQLFESVRITLFGALRGLKDTSFTLFTSIISFWFVALPLGYVLAKFLHLQGAGLWWGMTVGAASGAVLLFWRFQKIKPFGRRPKSVAYPD